MFSLLISQHHQNPFAEYFDGKEGKAAGIKDLCYSASGCLLALNSLDAMDALKTMLLPFKQSNFSIQQQAFVAAEKMLQSMTIIDGNIKAISVAGESGSGKSTIGFALKKVLEQKGYHVLLLHQDDYFKIPPKKNHEARLKSFDHIGTHEVRLDLMDGHIAAIKNKTVNTISIPVMNWEKDSEEAMLYDVSEVDMVIAEGTYTSLLQQVDDRIFITTNYIKTKQNRIDRNREPVTDFIEQVLEKESRIIQSHAPLANIWMDEKMNITLQQPKQRLQTT
jgi:uridine kinase